VKELEFGANSRILAKNELGLGSRTRTRMFMLTFLKPEHRNETASYIFCMTGIEELRFA
jgi:hypothetical protein